MNREPRTDWGLLVSLALLLASCQGWPGSPGGTTPTPEPRTFQGAVRRGGDLGEVKAYCAEGLYLVADEGFLTDQVTMLLLREPDAAGEPVMLDDPALEGQSVEVLGRYPAQGVFCEALTCGCEDYILVEGIDVR